MVIVAFGHKSRVGKDTASRLLMGHFRLYKPRLKVVKGSFARDLKLATYMMYSWAGVKEPIHYENYPSDREKILPALNCTVVDLWIKVGNLMRENVHQDTWVNCLFHNTIADLMIISDLRFPNEAKIIKDRGGLIYRIDRKDAPIRDSVSDRALDTWTEWDGIISNNGHLKSFSETIHGLISIISERLPK